MIVYDDILIASYAKATNSWLFGGVKINDNSSQQEILENHTEALNAVCNATLRNISDIATESARITAVQDATQRNASDIAAESARITAVQDALSNHTHTTIDNELSVNGNVIVKGINIISKITEMETILKNHYDALMVLCEKHGMVDSNTGDGSNVSPK